MQLRQFVSKTLCDIINGIKDAQIEELIGGLIAPSQIGGHDFPIESNVINQTRIVSTVVKFDVAVTAETEDKTKGEGGIKVIGIGANVEGEIINKDYSSSRIQFSVPIIFPNNPQKWSGS